VRRWQDIPAVPTGAFKELALTSFPRERAVHVFRTSGTTVSERGALLLDTLDVYEASLRASFARGVLPDLAPDARISLPGARAEHRRGARLLALAHVRHRDARRRQSRQRTLGRARALDAPRALRALEAAERSGDPVALCGTAFAFVHLLDELDRRGRRFALPRSARVMETGGFKGRAGPCRATSCTRGSKTASACLRRGSSTSTG
jgi:hypothetical protein